MFHSESIFCGTLYLPTMYLNSKCKKWTHSTLKYVKKVQFHEINSYSCTNSPFSELCKMLWIHYNTVDKKYISIDWKYIDSIVLTCK